MLATDWVYDQNNKNPQVRIRPKSLWDDLLSRHQRECDDLVRLEEKHGKKLKRIASTETVRESELTGRGDMVATSGEFIPEHSQQALQKRRRIDSRPESRESISSTASSISDFLSTPSIREAYSHHPLRPRRSSDSYLSTASESSFSNISCTSDWEMLDDESIGQHLNDEDTAITT